MHKLQRGDCFAATFGAPVDCMPGRQTENVGANELPCLLLRFDTQLRSSDKKANDDDDDCMTNCTVLPFSIRWKTFICASNLTISCTFGTTCIWKYVGQTNQSPFMFAEDEVYKALFFVVIDMAYGMLWHGEESDSTYQTRVVARSSRVHPGGGCRCGHTF